MEVSEKKLKEITRRVMLSRMRLLINNGFYGLLLMHMKFSISMEHDTAWTDGKERIWVNPDFVDRISDQELDYVLMHQVTHAALKHTSRYGNFKKELFDEAADIVVNSNIYHSNNDNESTICLERYGGVQPHKAPDGSEGYEHSVEALYKQLLITEWSDKRSRPAERANKKSDGIQNGKQDGKKTKGTSGEPPKETDGEASEEEAKTDLTQEDDKTDLTPNEKDGKENRKADEGLNENNKEEEKNRGWDYHKTQTGSSDEDLEDQMKWQGFMKQACEAISLRDPKKTRGMLPAFAQRFMDELGKSQVDWRQLLVEFIQDEINDYSFMPPDRRMEDCPFFLPDFNERDEKPGKVLFAVDTSASMSDKEIAACYAEIKGAIDQFNGRLEGWLCFFDAQITEPVAFYEVEDLLKIRPTGGGGTSFEVVFDYLETLSEEDLPQSIVVLTDGYAPFPDEKRARGIPVLWIIDNEEIEVPWGKIARIEVT